VGGVRQRARAPRLARPRFPRVRPPARSRASLPSSPASQIASVQTFLVYEPAAILFMATLSHIVARLLGIEVDRE
jgi:hypothetical protein